MNYGEFGLFIKSEVYGTCLSLWVLVGTSLYGCLRGLYIESSGRLSNGAVFDLVG